MTEAVLPRSSRWLHATTAVGLALAAHVGAAWYFSAQPPAQAMAEAPGVGGMLIDLGPAMAPAAEEPPAEEAPPEEPEAPPPEPEVQPEPEPEPEPEVVEEVPEDTVEVMETVPEEPPPPPKPKPKEPPPPKPKPKVPPKPVQPAPTPAPNPVPAPRPAAPQAPAAPQGPTQTLPAPGLTTPRATGQAVTGGGNPAARRSYTSDIQMWLERHKEYPRRARMRRQEGTATLFFVIDRSGKVLSYRLVSSSGYPVLDEEVQAMIRRASPLPPIPPDVPGATMELTVPVVFALR